MQFENRIYSRAEMREQEIDTSDYAIMTEAEEVQGTLVLKADARNRMLRLFFVLSDGRKIITPVFWWQRSAGFYDLTVGRKYRLRDREPTVRKFIKIAHHWEWDCGDALLPYLDPEYPNPRYSHIVDITIHKDLINDYTSDNHEEDYYVSEVDDNSAARKDYLYNMHIKCLNN